MITIHSCEQKSPEWFELRRQYPLTASKASAIATGGKGLETLVYEKLAEAYSTGEVEDYTNEHMARGVELEPHSRALYELERGVTVEEVGFITNDEISPVAGCSPDGLIGKDGGFETKAPSDTVYFRMLIADDREKEIPSDYRWQCQDCMLITGRKWCDLQFYNPNYSESTITFRIYADEEMQKKLTEGFKKGETLIKEITAKIK